MSTIEKTSSTEHKETVSNQKLSRDNAAVLLVDHQVKLVLGSRFPDPETLARNTVGLVQAAKILSVPVIATTTGNAVFGPTFSELVEALGDDEIIERSQINPFDDERVAEAIRATGRTHLIVAGVTLPVCAVFPALSAVESGLHTYVAVDASAALDELELRTSLHRLTQAGVIVATYGALVCEILADNADPKAQAVYQAIRTQHSVSTLAALGSSPQSGKARASTQ